MAKKTTPIISVNLTLKQLEMLVKFYSLGSYMEYGSGEYSGTKELEAVNVVYEKLMNQLTAHKSKMVHMDDETGEVIFTEKVMARQMQVIAEFMEWQAADFLDDNAVQTEDVLNYFSQEDGKIISSMHVVKNKEQN